MYVVGKKQELEGKVHTSGKTEWQIYQMGDFVTPT